MVVCTPRGLLNAKYLMSSRTTTRTSSTWMTAVSGSTRRPNSVTTEPSTLTRPCAMRSSAARREAMPARDSTFCSRTPSGGSEFIDGVHFWQQRRDRRQIVQRGQSEALEEQFRGAVEEAAGLDVGPRLLDQSTGEQGADDAVTVHTADRGDPGAGHRLTVGDDGEGLEGGPGALGTLAVE